MNAIDILLSSNKGIKKDKTKKVEVPRLTKEFGQKVVFTIKNISNKQYNDITEDATTIIGNQGIIDSTKFKYLIVIESLVDPNIKDARLKEKYKCQKNDEVLDNLLDSSEINEIFAKVLDLSGLDGQATREVVEEVKN